MLSVAFVSVTALVGAVVLGSITYLLVLTGAAAAGTQLPSVPAPPRTQL